MICWHDYEYIGYIDIYYWLAGVQGGKQVPSTGKAKQCTKCGKIKIIE